MRLLVGVVVPVLECPSDQRRAEYDAREVDVAQTGETRAIDSVTELLGNFLPAGLSRRSLLKGAGIGSLALAGLPTIGSIAARPAYAGDLYGFHLVTVSTPGGLPIGPGVDLLVVAGGGQIHGTTSISGSGHFVHLRAPNPVAPPFEVVAYGTWQAKELLDFNVIGAGLGFAAGTVDVTLEVTVAGTGDVLTLSSKLVCNLDAAGLVTGLKEGLYVPGTPVGDFEPLHPEVGLTALLPMA